jgi:hypothetical protein
MEWGVCFGAREACMSTRELIDSSLTHSLHFLSRREEAYGSKIIINNTTNKSSKTPRHLTPIYLGNSAMVLVKTTLPPKYTPNRAHEPFFLHKFTKTSTPPTTLPTDIRQPQTLDPKLF